MLQNNSKNRLKFLFPILVVLILILSIRKPNKALAAACVPPSTFSCEACRIAACWWNPSTEYCENDGTGSVEAHNCSLDGSQCVTDSYPGLGDNNVCHRRGETDCETTPDSGNVNCGEGGGEASPSPSPEPECEEDTPEMDIDIDEQDGPMAYPEPASYTVSWSRTGGDAGDSCSVTEDGEEFSTADSGSQAYADKMQGSYNYSASCENCDGTGTDTATANVSGNGIIQGKRVNGECLDTDLFDGDPTVYDVDGVPVSVEIYDAESPHPAKDDWNQNLDIYNTGIEVGMNKTYTVSVDEPPGYKAYYSVCENCIGHPAYTEGNTVNVTVPSEYASPELGYAFVDVYWKYLPEVMTVSGRVVKDSEPPTAGEYCTGEGICGFSGDCGGGFNWDGGAIITVSGCNNDADVIKVVGEDGEYDTGTELLYSPLYTVKISPISGWGNTCPPDDGDGGGTYSNITSVVGLNYANFYITPVKPAWWQAEIGNVHANGGNVGSSIPSTCTGSCKPYLITGLTAGLASYTGTLDTGEGTINESGDEWHAQTKYQGFLTGYGYFANILADDPVDSEVWDGSQPEEDKVYTYTDTDSISTSGIWTIPNDQKSVILVDGDVTITNNITVAEGGFLAIIASGNIIIDSGVTVLQGVYIADKVIETEALTTITQFQAEGIFTGWQGINLQRSLGIYNNTLPAEKFIYRPDLVRNAYKYLSKPKIGWEEVAP